MNAREIVNFTTIDVAKQFVVEEMTQLCDGEGETLAITFSGEPYSETVFQTLSKLKADSKVKMIAFGSSEELRQCLSRSEHQQRYQALFIFNSIHRLEQLKEIDLCFKQVLANKGRLHLSWPAKAVVSVSGGYSEKAIAESISGRKLSGFDDLRKDDQEYLDLLNSFQCQRLVKYDIGLAFQNLQGLKSWHKGGAEVLFGPDADESVREIKENYYRRLYELYLSGDYQARMSTTVADFILN